MLLKKRYIGDKNQGLNRLKEVATICFFIGWLKEEETRNSVLKRGRGFFDEKSFERNSELSFRSSTVKRQLIHGGLKGSPIF